VLLCALYVLCCGHSNDQCFVCAVLQNVLGVARIHILLCSPSYYVCAKYRTLSTISITFTLTHTTHPSTNKDHLRGGPRAARLSVLEPAERAGAARRRHQQQGHRCCVRQPATHSAGTMVFCAVWLCVAICLVYVVMLEIRTQSRQFYCPPYFLNLFWCGSSTLRVPTQNLTTSHTHQNTPLQVDDFSDLFAFKPEGNYILTFKNEDRPGAISEVAVCAVCDCACVLVNCCLCTDLC